MKVGEFKKRASAQDQSTKKEGKGTGAERKKPFVVDFGKLKDTQDLTERLVGVNSWLQDPDLRDDFVMQILTDTPAFYEIFYYSTVGGTFSIMKCVGKHREQANMYLAGAARDIPVSDVINTLNNIFRDTIQTCNSDDTTPSCNPDDPEKPSELVYKGTTVNYGTPYVEILTNKYSEELFNAMKIALGPLLLSTAQEETPRNILVIYGDYTLHIRESHLIGQTYVTTGDTLGHLTSCTANHVITGILDHFFHEERFGVNNNKYSIMENPEKVKVYSPEKAVESVSGFLKKAAELNREAASAHCPHPPFEKISREESLKRGSSAQEEQSEHRPRRAEGNTPYIAEMGKHLFFDLSDRDFSVKEMRCLLESVRTRLGRGGSLDVALVVNTDGADDKKRFSIQPAIDGKVNFIELDTVGEKGLSAVLNNSDHVIMLLENLISVMPPKVALERSSEDPLLVDAEKLNKDAEKLLNEAREFEEQRLKKATEPSKEKTCYPENQSYPFECPRCKGRGELPRLEDMATHFSIEKITTCGICNGTGVLWSRPATLIGLDPSKGGSVSAVTMYGPGAVLEKIVTTEDMSMGPKIKGENNDKKD